MAGVNADNFDETEHVHFQFIQIASYVDYRSVVLNQPSELCPRHGYYSTMNPQSMFYNKELLKNIKKSDTHMDIRCNAGVTSTHLIRDLPGYSEVWYHPNSITYTLSLARVKEKHSITFNSGDKSQFVVHKSDGTTRCFKDSRRGLYFLEMGNTPTILVNTVDNNKSR
jgi:hypothetical protein